MKKIVHKFDIGQKVYFKFMSTIHCFTIETITVYKTDKILNIHYSGGLFNDFLESELYVTKEELLKGGAK